jgi:hypothetical protein
MLPLTFFATLLLLLLEYAASAAWIINDKPSSNLIDKPTSNLINHLDPITTVNALQALRDENISKNLQENAQRQRFLAEESASSSHEEHESRKMKPDSTKSAKNDSKCAKNNIENNYFAEMEMCNAELADTKAELADTKGELAELKKEMSKTQWLSVQVADKCVLDLSGDKPTIESAHFHEDTEMFADRPLTYEETSPTDDWFTRFNDLFLDDGWEWPNSAMTFVNDDESVGVVVTAFVNGYGYIKEGSGGGNQTIYGYNLDQSEEQKNVKSLEEIAGGQDKVEFDHCSFFIDDLKFECAWKYFIR